MKTATRSKSLHAGIGKVDITRTEATETNDPLYANIDPDMINDRLYVKALVLRQGATTAVLITVDAVAIAQIGTIRDEYLAHVRAQLHDDLQIEATSVLINASHCHGVVCTDIVDRTVQAVKKACREMVPVKVGAGTGHEDRIMENRRLPLISGREADARHAYSMPPDNQVADVGPVDPEIGIVKLERENGQIFAIVYNFACHPIQGVPSGGNTADLSGFASKVIEDCCDEGTMAFFLQGCAADINPVRYKDVHQPRDAEPLGNLLGLSTMRALRDIKTEEGGTLKIVNEKLALPRANLTPAIAELHEKQQHLLQSLTGTTLNLKTFMPLIVKYQLAPDTPSYYSHRYLHEKKQGRQHLAKLDADNRHSMTQYMENIHTMEELTKVQENLGLLQMHQAKNEAAGEDTIEVELVGLRIGEFVLTTFPGELSVQTGLSLKQASPHPLTFVAGVTNGYIYYTPTTQQLANRGGAQEDSDCLVAPEWQALYESKALQILRGL